MPQTKRAHAIYCSVKCQAAAHGQRHRDANKSEIIENRRTYRSENAENYLLYRSRHRAKVAGIPHDIDLSDIVVPARCPVLGIPLMWNHGIGRRGFHPNSPSLDKIKPASGYVKGNVRVISARANLLKNDASVAELEAVLHDLKQIEVR